MPSAQNLDGRSDGLVLGIDPGLASTGWGLVQDGFRVIASGTIRTQPGDAGRRLVLIGGALESLLGVHLVKEAALEELFMGRNRTSAIGVAQARGVILMVLEQRGVPVFEYKPSQVKATLTGYGAAGKGQMARMLAVHVGPGRGRARVGQEPLTPMDDHAVDAVAIAICHARSRGLLRQARPHEFATGSRP